MKFKAEIKVLLKDDIKDPQGIQTEIILNRTGIDESAKVRTGKYFILTVNAKNEETAYKKIKNICEDVLTNPCLEKYEILKAEKE